MSVSAATTFANREVYNLKICDYNTKKPVIYIDWANGTANELSGEAVYAYGGWQHPKRVTFYGEKGGTLTLETQMQSYQLYSIITGAAIESTAKFLEREVVTATEDGKLSIKGTPIEGSINMFTSEDDCGTPLEVTANGKELACDAITAKSTYVVYYMKEYTKGVTKLNIRNTTVPKSCIIYGDTISKTEDDVIVSQRLIAYKATPQQNVSWSYSNTGDPASLSITFDLLCDEDDNLLDLITIEDSAEDEGNSDTPPVVDP